MKLQPNPKGRWRLSLGKPDIAVERHAAPAKLDLDGAVSWIKTNKPILWIGSIFSVPEPSGFPSGYAISRSLFNLIFLRESHIPELARERLIAELIPKWPLEALFDEFSFLGFDLSESLLSFFAEHDQTAAPNVLHEAVAKYYENGLSRAPLCVTTNWDSLLEKAFRSNGYRVHVVGSHKSLSRNFGKADPAEKVISISTTLTGPL